MEMCICGFLFQRYGKTTHGFRIFRHFLSCSVCIILTYSLENGERRYIDGSNCFYYTCIQSIKACEKKRQPHALAYLFVLQSVLFFFLCFPSYYSLSNDKQFLIPLQ